MWHVATWFNGGLDTAGFVVGHDGPRALFQPGSMMNNKPVLHHMDGQAQTSTVSDISLPD